MAKADSSRVNRSGRPAASDDRSGRIRGSNMIQPGAKPQFDRETPMDKVVKAAKKVAKKVRGK